MEPSKYKFVKTSDYNLSEVWYYSEVIDPSGLQLCNMYNNLLTSKIFCRIHASFDQLIGERPGIIFFN